MKNDLKKYYSKSVCVFIIFVVLLSQSSLSSWTLIKELSYTYIRLHASSTKDTIILNQFIVSSNSEIQWIEKDEIRYKGKMFDVQNSITSGKEIYLIGNYDSFENNLFKILNKLVDTNGNANHDRKKGVTLLMFDAIIPLAYKWEPSRACTEKTTYFYNEPEYPSLTIQKNIQPPDII